MNRDIYWMTEALRDAEQSMEEFHELPIATILVANDNEIGRETISNVRNNSFVAHSELLVLMDVEMKILTCERPLVLYTTLEPCIMCLGAAIECCIDRIVYAMPAFDGGVGFVSGIIGISKKLPAITSGIMEKEQYKLMKRFIASNNVASPAWRYVNQLVNQYEAIVGL